MALADDPPDASPDTSGAEYLAFPDNVELAVDLPPMCIVGNRDDAISTAAALNTPYFPKLRHIIIDGINRRLAEQWP